MAMLVAFWRRVGAGSSAPLRVHPTCGSLYGGRREADPSAVFSRSAGMERCWITLQRAAPVPRPSLVSPPNLPPPQSLSARLQPLWDGNRSRARGPGPWCAMKEAVGTWSHAGCRLTGAGRTQDSHAGCGWGAASPTREADALGGRWAPRTSSLSSSSVLLGTHELFIGITHSWKCDLASPSYTPTESLLACSL